jgi:hypothetical protein
MNDYLPATTSPVAMKESIALAYCGSLSPKYLEVSLHSIVATPSIMAPYKTGI